MKTDASIAIIGGGIGGLTAAIALHQKGFRPAVYESAPGLRPIGAGITLAINAMRVFQRLGLAEAAIGAGRALEQLWITDEQLRPISRTALHPLIEEFGLPNLGIHRGALQRLLVEALPEDALRTGKSLLRLEEAADGVQLHFEDGTRAEAEIAIAADGIHSAVRRQLFPSCRRRRSGQVCWRGACRADTGPWQARGTEAWAPGKRFGIVPITKDSVYWFAVVNEKPGYDWAQLTKEGLMDTFRPFSRPVQELIGQTAAGQIIFSPINDLEPLPRWHSARAVLLGDAAHATTPNMGQGACQAIEDAYALAACLATLPPEQAFPRYQSLRKPRADSIVRQSRRLGKMAQLEAPWLCRLRNRAIGLTPPTIALRALREVMQGSFE